MSHPSENVLEQARAALLEIHFMDVVAAAKAVVRSHTSGGTIWTIGNGGSAGTASHLSADLAGWASRKSARAIRSICLCDNLVAYSASVNDDGWERVYSARLARLATGADLLIALSVHGGSGSGDAGHPWSGNLVGAATSFRGLGGGVVAFTGFDGGPLRAAADVSLHVPSRSTPVVEGVHSVLAHALVDEVQAMLGTAVPPGKSR